MAGRRRKTKLSDSIKTMYPWRVGDAGVRYMAAEAAAEEWLRTQPCDVHLTSTLQEYGSIKPEQNY